MCGVEREDLKHFLLWCPAYTQERRKSERLQQPYPEEEEDVIGQYLFENKFTEETKRTLYSFWKIREKKTGTERREKSEGSDGRKGRKIRELRQPRKKCQLELK